jgi:hypothetical protein
MANFKLTLLAQQDLRTIHDYIAANNPKAATRYIGPGQALPVNRIYLVPFTD